MGWATAAQGLGAGLDKLGGVLSYEKHKKTEEDRQAAMDEIAKRRDAIQAILDELHGKTLQADLDRGVVTDENNALDAARRRAHEDIDTQEGRPLDDLPGEVTAGPSVMAGGSGGAFSPKFALPTDVTKTVTPISVPRGRGMSDFLITPRSGEQMAAASAARKGAEQTAVTEAENNKWQNIPEGGTLAQPATGRVIKGEPKPENVQILKGVVDGAEGSVKKYPDGRMVNVKTGKDTTDFHATESQYQGGAAVDLTPDAIEQLAMKVHIFGQGEISTRINEQKRTAVLNREAEIGKLMGQTPIMGIQKRLAMKADAGSLANITKLGDAMRAAQAKAEPQADVIADLSKKVSRTSMPLINEAMLAGETKILGDENASLLLSALTEFTSEYAKIIEGSAASAGGASVEARRAAASLVTAVMTKGQVAKQIAQMRQFMDYAVQGNDVAVAGITERMLKAGTVPGKEETAPSGFTLPGSTPKGGTAVLHKVGDPVVGADGKTVYVTAVSPDGKQIQTSPTKPGGRGGGL